MITFHFWITDARQVVLHERPLVGPPRLSTLTPFDPVDPTSPCPCGSGLGYASCCGLDWTAPWPQSESATDLGGERAALAAGDKANAERQLVKILERSPRNVSALALLCELRATEGRAAAAEALLARIVRLDSNNLPATQALALSLFNRGALGLLSAIPRPGLPCLRVLTRYYTATNLQGKYNVPWRSVNDNTSV